MLEVLDETSDDLVAFRISGKHIHDESHKIASLIDARIMRYGHARCFIEIGDTTGVTLSSLKEGLDFDLQHGMQIERCAVVGDHAWEAWLVKVLGLFFRKAEVRFFHGADRAAALAWAKAE
jgi:hypothetical protein